mmetsp:Transcript_5747/g.14356  ORF Transcript_5747/g.14356 Transcript_5747/m.14356 type:complete len:80 (-) Transcript_5747:913-1152(-)
MAIMLETRLGFGWETASEGALPPWDPMSDSRSEVESEIRWGLSWEAQSEVWSGEGWDIMSDLRWEFELEKGWDPMLEKH